MADRFRSQRGEKNHWARGGWVKGRGEIHFNEMVVIKGNSGSRGKAVAADQGTILDRRTEGCAVARRTTKKNGDRGVARDGKL